MRRQLVIVWKSSELACSGCSSFVEKFSRSPSDVVSPPSVAGGGSSSGGRHPPTNGRTDGRRLDEASSSVHVGEAAEREREEGRVGRSWQGSDSRVRSFIRSFVGPAKRCLRQKEPSFV